MSEMNNTITEKTNSPSNMRELHDLLREEFMTAKDMNAQFHLKLRVKILVEEYFLLILLLAVLV